MNWTPNVRNAILGTLAALLLLLAPAMVIASETSGETTDRVIEHDLLLENERAMPLGNVDADPLGLLWDEEGLPFDEEIVIKDGLIYT